MDVVKKFLECRQKGDVEGACALLEPNTTLGSPWGYRYGEAEYTEFLRDEVGFNFREYLDCSDFEEVSTNAFQRKFGYNKGHATISSVQKSHWFPVNHWLSWIPLKLPYAVYREVYWVKDGKVRCVTCFKQN